MLEEVQVSSTYNMNQPSLQQLVNKVTTLSSITFEAVTTLSALCTYHLWSEGVQVRKKCALEEKALAEEQRVALPHRRVLRPPATPP